MGATFGPLTPLDSTPTANGPTFFENFYATGAVVSPGVVVTAWTRESQDDDVIFEARAVRWTQDLTGDVGPIFRGPGIPNDPYGNNYQSRLLGVMKIAEDMALVIPGDSVTDTTIVGWRIHVDPSTLAISYIDSVHWPDTYNNDDYGFRVPGDGRAAISMNLQPVAGGAISYGWVSFNTDTGAVQNLVTYEDSSGPMNNLCGVVDLGSQFLLLCKMPSDTVAAVGTSGQLGYRPAYTPMSFWLVDSVNGAPANSGTKVMMYDDVVDGDGVYPVKMPNGHIHVLFDCWSKYIYNGDPNTAKGVLIDVNPNTWTYTQGPVQPYVANGSAGGLQDYENIAVFRDDMSLFCIWSNYTDGFPATDGVGGGLRVGTFDGTNVSATLAYDWSQITSRYSCEIFATGGMGFILIVNGDQNSPEAWGQVWSVCGTALEVGEIDGAMDVNRSAFW